MFSVIHNAGAPPAAAAAIIARRVVARPDWVRETSTQLEWASIAARLLLAAALLAAPAVSQALNPIWPVAISAATVLLVSVPVMAFMALRCAPAQTAAASITLDTLTVTAAVLGANWMLANSDAASGSIIAPLGIVLIAAITATSVLRLRALPASLYIAALTAVTAAIALATALAAPSGMTNTVAALPLAISILASGAFALAASRQLREPITGLSGAGDLELISTVAHEIKNPLASARAYIGLLTDPAAGRLNERQMMIAGRANRSIMRLEQLVSMLSYAEAAGSDGRVLSLRSVQLRDVVEAAIEQFAPIADDRDISLEFADLGDLPPVWADRGALDQMLANLLSNAIKFSHEGTTVTIAGYSDRSGAGLQVTDRGMGMSPEDQEHIFERCFRSSNPAKNRIPGTGLGLYITRQLAARLDGNVWFTSAEDKGSTFGFAMPFAPAGRNIVEFTNPARRRVGHLV